MTALALWKGAVQPPAQGWDRDFITSENLNTYSIPDSANTGWVNNATACTANAAVAPNGATEATKVASDTVGGSSGNVYLRSAALSIPLNGPLIHSVYAKYGSKDWIQFRMVNYETATAYFDITNGRIGTTISGLTLRAGIEPAQNTYPDAPAGWYRCWVELDQAVADVTGSVAWGTVTGDGDASATRDGSFYSYFWGAQTQRGSNTLGPLIETAGSAATATRQRTEATTHAWVPSNTNYMAHSEDLVDNSGAWWPTNDLTMKYGEHQPPSRVGRSYILEATTQAGVQLPFVNDTAYDPGIPSPYTFTIGMFVYNSQEDDTYPIIRALNIDEPITCIFDPGSGTVYETGTGTADASGILPATDLYPDAPDGWSFCYLTLTCPTDQVGNYGPAIGELTTQHRITGPTTADKMEFWGFQISDGDVTQWKYVPTPATATGSRTSGAFNNVLYRHKGAVQPAKTYLGTYAAQGGVAWVDYIPVYQVTGRTKRWRTDDNQGFIPVVYK